VQRVKHRPAFTIRRIGDRGRFRGEAGLHAVLQVTPEDSPSPTLRVTDLVVRFGGIVALDGISFDVERGQICGIIGPNGAGKTTLFNCLSRIYPYERGTIVFEGQSIDHLPRHRIAALGIGRTFQNLAMFRTMTVAENIAAGSHCRTRTGYLANLLRWPSVAREETIVEQKIQGLIDMLSLRRVVAARVADLPFGIQKRVELARALASEPRLLLLDEPAAGLIHEELDELRELILHVQKTLDLTILLVEHHMTLVMRVSDKVVALDFGRKIFDGTPVEAHNDENVLRAYLGAPA
jgi:branched-chain amino acid transport system ATP-binding protein